MSNNSISNARSFNGFKSIVAFANAACNIKALAPYREMASEAVKVASDGNVEAVYEAVKRIQDALGREWNGIVPFAVEKGMFFDRSKMTVIKPAPAEVAMYHFTAFMAHFIAQEWPCANGEAGNAFVERQWALLEKVTSMIWNGEKWTRNTRSDMRPHATQYRSVRRDENLNWWWTKFPRIMAQRASEGNMAAPTVERLGSSNSSMVVKPNASTKFHWDAAWEAASEILGKEVLAEEGTIETTMEYMLALDAEVEGREAIAFERARRMSEIFDEFARRVCGDKMAIEE